jgi:mono/diheme cytochrome c family protein
VIGRHSSKRASASAATRRRLLAAALAAVIAVGAAIAWVLLQPALPPIDPDDPAQVALGQSVYAAQCARCHGVRLEGQPNWRDRLDNGRLPAPPHDADGHTWHHPDAQLFGITKHGLAPYVEPGYQSDMPAFDGILTDDEIAASLAYIKSTWPPDIRAHNARINAQARQ